VAKIGYDGMLKEQLVVFNDKQMSFFMQWIIPLLPRRFVLRQIASMQEK
jgi:hypothetical protein